MLMVAYITKDNNMSTVTFKYRNEKKPFAAFYAASPESAMKIANQVNGGKILAHVEYK